MKKILLAVIATILCSTLIGGDTVRTTILSVKGIREKDSYTYLVCGLDDASENTDAIILFNYNTSDNIASFIQIPRDTYFDYSDNVKKINSIYPSLRCDGIDPQTAMCELTRSIEQALSIKLDGYICFTIDALERFIDGIGGVDVDIPYDINITDSDGNNNVVFSKGTHHLNGAQAVRFIRFRKGYALGDLGRIDAQKLFLSGFVSKLKSSLNVKVVAKAALRSEGGVLTDIRIMDMLAIALKMRNKIQVSNVIYANLPGTADTLNDDRWYYFVNKFAAAELLDNLNLKTHSSFDGSNKLLNSSNEKTKEYYFNTHTKWRILTDSDLKSIMGDGRSA